MQASVEFYVMRADQCAADAQAADLANVHERCLRAESAWRAMATRLQDAETEKKQFATQKALLGESMN